LPFLIAVDGGEPGFYEGTDKIRLGATYNTYDITGIPTTVLIDTEGKITGELKLSRAKEKLEAMLGVMIEPELADWRQRFNKVYFFRIGPVCLRVRVDFFQLSNSKS